MSDAQPIRHATDLRNSLTAKIPAPIKSTYIAGHFGNNKGMKQIRPIAITERIVSESTLHGMQRFRREGPQAH